MNCPSEAPGFGARNLLFASGKSRSLAALGMTILWLGTAILVLAGLLSQSGVAQDDSYINPSPPEGITVRQIIQRFAEQEAVYKQEREHYTYREIVKLQTIDDRGFVDGEYDDSFDVTFDDQGERVVKQVSHPRDSLKRIRVTPEDISDMRDRMPFVLTADEIPEYNIHYVGQQDTDGTHAYVFEISPKAMAEGQRYFEGRIWVDAQAFQIVKSYGKAVPDLINRQGENLFPKFTTYRELVDGKYWFPSYTRANDTLYFSNSPVHIIEDVDYTNYKRFGSQSKIIYNGQELPQDQNKDQQQPPTSQRQSGVPQPPGYGQQNPNQPAQNPRRGGPPAPQQQAQVPPRGGANPAVNPPQQPVQYVQQALISLEREISDAITNKEISTLERVLTDDFKLISANGDAEDKFSLLDDIHQGRAGSFGQPQNLQVQVKGDRAIVTGVREESVPTGPHRVQTAHVRFTDTFVRRAGEWLLMESRESAAR